MSGRIRNGLIFAAALFFAVSLGVYNFLTYRALTGLHAGMKETAGSLNQLELEMENMGSNLSATRKYLGLEGTDSDTGLPEPGNYYSALDALLGEYGKTDSMPEKGDSEADRFARLVKSPTFRSFIEKRGCTVSEIPAESDESIDYIISDSTGEKVGRISFNRKTDRIHVFDRDNVIVSPVKKN